MAEYVLLQSQEVKVPDDEGGDIAVMTWIPLRRETGRILIVEAPGQQEAVDQYKDDYGLTEGRFKAVALINWRGVITLKESKQYHTVVEVDDDLGDPEALDGG